MTDSSIRDTAQAAGDVATRAIGSAAGAVVDPATAVTKARSGLAARKGLLVALVLGLVVLVALRRRPR